MFGSNNKKDTESETQINSPTKSNSINSLGSGTKVEGTLTAHSDIRIDGELIGHLDCKGKLIIGPQGVIDGDIKCKNALIEGTFKGKLKVAELLNVRESAKIHGEISTKQLMVASGAEFNVSCEMGQSHAPKKVIKAENGKEEKVLSFSADNP